MKRILLFISLVFAYYQAQAQFPTPVSWSAKWEAVSATEYDLIFTAEIDPGWNIYSQYLESDDGPIATQLNFTSPSGLERLGEPAETGTIKEGYDEIFEMNVTKLFDKAVITQRVQLTDLPQVIEGYITYMVCDKEQCLPPTDYEFSLNISAAPDKPDAEASGVSLLADTAPADEPTGSPVQWSASVNSLGNDEYELIWTADFPEPWTLYSQHIEGDGPIPTSFALDAGAHYEALGATSERAEKSKAGFDELFGIEVKKFVTGPAVFTQKIKLLDPNTPITGELVFMVCDEEQCLPPDYRYYRFMPARGEALLGLEPIEGGIRAEVAVDEATETLYGNLQQPDLDNPLAACTPDSARVAQNSSMLRIFFLGILGGLIALLTPCVFPMIPLTVSFFTKRSEDRQQGIRNAFVYGGFIVLVYLLLSLPFHLLSSVSPDVLNQISTNIWLNLSFFVIFLVFAFSFFGLYEITLPSSWTNKSSQAEGIGGAVGIFFMALTLALVSFSCTGPILGTLLVGALSSDGGAWQLTSGMAGFGVGLALPFGVFAAFPGFMSSLPKSGGWLNTVKVTLGFLELALALKFLSNADMVKHWGILKVELFLGLWIVIFAVLALYLFGIIRFPHDSKGQKIPLVQKLLGGLSVAFVVYLATGFTINQEMGSYRPLKLLSGLAPPVCYSYFQPCDCPQQLTCFKDLKEGLAYAKKQDKPVLLDFTGYACVNCRKMEEHVWPEPAVYSYLKDDFVLISLYVDDKQALPEEQQLRVKTFQGTKTLRTYGNKWSYFQETYFNAVAQPYYVLVTPELELLNAPAAYTPDAAEYARFLECGKQTYEQLR